MRKIQSDEEILQLSEQGMTGTALAKHYGVSEAAISKRLKRLRQQAPPESFTRLSEKKRKFAVCLSQGMTQTDACMQSHDVVDRNSAKSLGHKLATDPDISTCVTDLLMQAGIGKRTRSEQLAKMVLSADLGIVGRGLELSYRLDKSFDERVIVGIDPETIRQLARSFPMPDGSPPFIDITPAISQIHQQEA